MGRAFTRAVQEQIRASQQAAKMRNESGASGGAKSVARDNLTGMTVQVTITMNSFVCMLLD